MNNRDSSEAVVGLIVVVAVLAVVMVFSFSNGIGVSFNTGFHALSGSVVACLAAGGMAFFLQRVWAAVPLLMNGMWIAWHPVFLEWAMPFKPSIWGQGRETAFDFIGASPFYLSTWFYWIVVLALFAAMVILFIAAPEDRYGRYNRYW